MMDPHSQLCRNGPRRDFLQLGIGGVMGLGFSDILRLRASAASAQAGAKSAGNRSIAS